MSQNLYECSIRSTSIPAGGTYSVVFTSGATHCIFLDRLVGFNGVAAKAEVYRTPTFTGGTTADFFAIDTASGIPSISVFKAGPTVTAVGTKVGATSYYRGTDPLANGVVGTYGSQRGRRRLAPYTTYLLQFTNEDASAQVIDVYFRWYEGPMFYPGGIS
jgi:hypothetical protein